MADFVSGTLSGALEGMKTIYHKDMTRSSSESSFLRAALSNPGPSIYKNSLAKNVLFNGTRAAGM